MNELYCLDASVFINAWSKHYPEELFPCVWDCLDELLFSQKVIIPVVVLEEVQRGQDKLVNWIEWAERGCVKKPDADCIAATKHVVQAHRRLLETKKNRSGSGADPWVIGYAQVAGAVVVTEERATNDIAKPKIPDVCKAMGIECINTVELLRRSGFKSVREKAKP